MGRYLLGVAELGVIVGFAWLGAGALRRRFVPALEGAPAHLATTVVVLSLLLLTAELLGTIGAFDSVPYLLAVIVVGVVLWRLMGGQWGGPSGAAASCFSPDLRSRTAADDSGEKPSKPEGPPHWPPAHVVVALVIAAVAIVHFAAGVKLRLSTGMTGFDSTWYHGPFAAGFFQSGDTWSLHFIAPQFLAWFYPANSEVLHGVGMLAFGRDLLSPLLNFGWFVGCLVAGWCIGRPYRVAPFSLALTAVALSVPALHDQAGEARNDIVGIFFLLAAVAVALNARAGPNAEGPRKSSIEEEGSAVVGSMPIGAFAVAGLAAGLAAGTKLNFLFPAGVLVAGLVAIAPRGTRGKVLAAGGLAAVAGGGYWYLRNLAHAGNPLPWVKHLGPITLPAPEQALGGREAHSVLDYLTDGSVWSDWFLPGLHHGLTILWPLALAFALAGLLMSLGSRSDPMLRVAGAVGLAAALAWLIAPTSASGPDGMPHGFESGLRYLTPALILGLALLPATPPLRPHLASMRSYFSPHTGDSYDRKTEPDGWKPLRSYFPPLSGEKYDRWGLGWIVVLGLGLIALVVAIGYPVQRHYLRARYASPTFTTPGLNAAFRWAQGVTDFRIATTSTRQYPLFGRDLSSEVTYIGIEQPHGGFTAPTTCPQWRRLLNAGNYDYVIATRDRIEPSKPTYPPTAHWTAAPNATVILRKPPTIVFKLRGKLNPSGCR